MKNTFALAAAAALVLPFCHGCTSLKRFGYEGFGRDRWQHPQEVIGALRIQPGDAIADLGAGGGYFTFRLAEATGPTGVVYAVDVDPDMIDYLEKRAAEDKAENVKVILGAYDDPRLPEDSVDLLFTSNTYHHIEDRTAYFAKVRKYLRPSGQVAIIDYERRGFFHRILGHATSGEVVRKEMEAAGYRLESEPDFLQRQSFLVFSK